MPKAAPKSATTVPPVAALDPQPASYEAALAEIEGLVAQLEDGALPLDALLGSYSRGAGLLAYCRAQLQSVEDQARLLDERLFERLG
jgi:exodeoxyribonuclease VII small subunit